jgi:hypothetical protein
MKKTKNTFWLLSLFSVWLMACEKNNSIGLDILDDDVSVFSTDTATLITSTVILDSIQSSGTGRALAGVLKDQQIGTIESKAYFQIGLGNEMRSIVGAEFDSLVLYLGYNYYFGDTTKLQKLRIRRLRGKLALPEDQSAFYTSSSLLAINENLATLSFFPRPNTLKPLRMRLPDALGRDILQLAENESDTIKNTDDFEQYLRGFLLEAEAGTESILGFQTSVDTTNNQGIFMRLFYHKGLVKYEHNFPLTKADLQFNQIINNRQGTGLANLQTQKVDLNSKSTDNQAFNIGGVGMMIKVKIPYLSSSLNLGGLSHILYAELICKPVKGTYNSTLPLPEELEMYATDKQNRFISAIVDRNGDALKAKLVLDREFGKETYYKFDLTNYILSELSNNQQRDNSLLITLPLTDLQNSFNRVILGNSTNQGYKMQLKIIYTKF